MKKRDEGYVRLVQQEALILDVTEMLVQVLEEADVSRKELAERLGCTPGYVSQLLAGGKNLTLRTISDVAFALDLKPTFLLTHEDPAKEYLEWTSRLPESPRWNPSRLRNWRSSAE